MQKKIIFADNQLGKAQRLRFVTCKLSRSWS